MLSCTFISFHFILFHRAYAVYSIHALVNLLFGGAFVTDRTSQCSFFGDKRYIYFCSKFKHLISLGASGGRNVRYPKMFSIYLVHWVNKLLEKNKSRSLSTVRVKWQPQLADACNVCKEKDGKKEANKLERGRRVFFSSALKQMQ